jgi:hypothetical protein
MEPMSHLAGQKSISPDAYDAVVQAAQFTPVSELGLTKFLDLLLIPSVIAVPTSQPHQRLNITMRTARVKLHSHLPSTRVWVYGI